MKQPAVYIITNKKNGTLYVGVTSYLEQRIYQHKNGVYPGFAKRYKCDKLVYYELFDEMINAIIYEKKVKAKTRKNKLSLIESKNKDWKDLYEFF